MKEKKKSLKPQDNIKPNKRPNYRPCPNGGWCMNPACMFGCVD